MKKRVELLVVIFAFIFLFSVKCYAADDSAAAMEKEQTVKCGVVVKNSSTKTYRYCGSMLKKKNVYLPDMGYVYKAKLTGKKLVLNGRLLRYKGASGKKSKLLRNKKHTFRLAKNVKFYSVGGEMPAYRVTRKQFRYTMTRYNGLYLSVYVKNGKVTKMYISS